MNWDWSGDDMTAEEDPLRFRRNIYSGEDNPALYDPPESARPVSSADVVSAKSDIPNVEMPRNPNQELLNQLSNWVVRRPKQEDYKPSTGRKILGTLIGTLAGWGHPEVARDITSGFVNKKYNEAQGNWEEEGKALGTVAPILGRERASDIRQYGYDISQRGDTIARTNAKERLGLNEKQLESLDKWRNGMLEDNDLDRATREKISKEDIAARDRATAARREATKAAGERQDKALKAGAETEENIPISEQDKAEILATRDAIREVPEWADYVDENGAIKPPKSSADVEDYSAFLRAVEEKKKGKLGLRRKGQSKSKTVEPISSFDNED